MSGRVIGRCVGEERGVTLIEMMVVLVILGIILAGMTTLFMSANKSQIDQTNRHEAQQNARLALDSLRREVRCANAITPAGSGSSKTITLGPYCPTYKATEPSVTWCAHKVDATDRYELLRYGTAPVTCGDAGGVVHADHLTTGTIFTAYVAPAGGNLGTLEITLPVDVSPNDARQRFTLRDDIALRNAGRG